MSKLQDKKAIMNVLGCLIKDPVLLSKAKGYDLTIEDFPEQFHKIVFSGIVNLKEEGIESLTVNDIYTYLSNFPKQLAIFENADGLDYIDKCTEISALENFDYYFQRVRKYSFLRECKMVGIDTSDIFDETALDPAEVEKSNMQFDDMSLEEMMKHIELKLVELKDKFRNSSESISEQMGDGVDELLDSALEAPSYGANFGSGYSNTITRGAKAMKFYLRSAPTGGGKTRYNLADLLEICIQERYEIKENAWVKTGADGAGLFITTEIPKDDIRMACLCYIAEVDEDKVKDNELTEDEIARLVKAKQVLKDSKLRIEQLEDFDLEQIEITIEKNILKYDIRFVVFDYIHTSLRLLTEIGKQAKGLREDLILLILSDKLKGSANKYQITMISSTQMNDNWKQDGTKNLDQSSLRGSKAIADKIDVGMILMPLDKKDREFYDTMKHQVKGFIPEPTHTINYYKNRESKWNNVRVWVNINMGTLRTKDCFVTTRDGEYVDNIQPLFIKYEEEELVEVFSENAIKDEDYENEIIEDDLPESFNETEEEIKTKANTNVKDDLNWL